MSAMVRIQTHKITDQLGSLGEFIAGQRRAARLSLRQLAAQTGISNPYLSQIERGLRKPSAEVLQQLAKALRISAETLYVRAGILDPDDHPATSVEMAVFADAAITERQKRVLIDVYTSFVKENSRSANGQALKRTKQESSESAHVGDHLAEAVQEFA
jgi:transcriptional regulator with XRE-family HTH domain